MLPNVCHEELIFKYCTHSFIFSVSVLNYVKSLKICATFGCKLTLLTNFHIFLVFSAKVTAMEHNKNELFCIIKIHSSLSAVKYSMTGCA